MKPVGELKILNHQPYIIMTHEDLCAIQHIVDIAPKEAQWFHRVERSIEKGVIMYNLYEMYIPEQYCSAAEVDTDPEMMMKFFQELSKEHGPETANDIVQKHLKKIGKTNNNIKIVANDFYHIKHLKAGFDAAWLCFENFEGVESKLENLEVKKVYLEDVEIPNFCALDVFASKEFANSNKNIINDFKSITQDSIKFLSGDLDYSRLAYYNYTKQKPSPLMDNIIQDTMRRFKNPFDNSKNKWKNLHQYVVTKKISDISDVQYSDMFL